LGLWQGNTSRQIKIIHIMVRKQKEEDTAGFHNPLHGHVHKAPPLKALPPLKSTTRSTYGSKTQTTAIITSHLGRMEVLLDQTPFFCLEMTFAIQGPVDSGFGGAGSSS
jgi:hypothetical protein